MPKPNPVKLQNIQDIVNDWVRLVDPVTVEESVHRWVGREVRATRNEIKNPENHE